MPASPETNGDEAPRSRAVDDLEWFEQAELVLSASARIIGAQAETAENKLIGFVYNAAQRHALEAITLMETARELDRDAALGAAELERARRERGK